MNRRTALILAATTLATLLALFGCDSDTTTIPDTGVVPDFALTDVNATSSTMGLDVSPRDHLGKISAWYFTRST